jgi:phage-related protein
LRGLDPGDREVIGSDLRTAQIGFPLGMPLCRPLGQGLHEVRTSLPSKREARLIFFQDDELLIVVAGFIKKTQATPAKELTLARRRQSEYMRNKTIPPKRQDL